MKIRRGIGIAAVAGALVLAASASASATETAWFWNNGLYYNNGTYSNAYIGTSNVTGQEYGAGYPGSIAAKCYWSPNGINYYVGTKDWDAYTAVGECGYYGQAIKLDHN